MEQSAFRLYMMMIGCRPAGRFTEQHDIFFGIAQHPADLIPDMIDFWPETKGKMHVDALRAVRFVDGYEVHVRPGANNATATEAKLFFINLGGYTRNVFDEAHYKMLAAAPEKGAAIQASKQTAFYKHTGYKEAPSHVDDKYGVDVDDVYQIEDILPSKFKARFSIELKRTEAAEEDEIVLGYITLDKLRNDF